MRMERFLKDFKAFDDVHRFFQVDMNFFKMLRCLIDFFDQLSILEEILIDFGSETP